MEREFNAGAEKTHSRLSQSTEETETMETSRSKDGADGESEMQRQSSTMKKRSQSTESLEDILQDAPSSQGHGQGHSAGPSRVEMKKETQSAEVYNENMAWGTGKAPSEKLSGTLHYSTKEKEKSQVATEGPDSICKERLETEMGGKVDYEIMEDVRRQHNKMADGQDSVSSMRTQSESVNKEFTDKQDSCRQQQSLADDWLQESTCHEETALTSSQQHEKADLSLKVGDSKERPMASMEVDASEESERYLKQESEKLEKDGHKLELTSTKETGRDENYEKIGMAAKTQKGEILEESGVHHLSSNQKLMDEKTEETCSDGVLKRSSSMELLESENMENTECDRKTVVEKDESGKTRQSSSMRSSTQKESHKRASHQASSESVQTSGTPGKVPRFQKQKRKKCSFGPQLGAWGSLADRERVFDPRLGKYVTKLGPQEACKMAADVREGDKEGHTDKDATYRDNINVRSGGSSAESTIPTPLVPTGFNQALSETSTDYEPDASSEADAQSLKPAAAPIGTIDELDDYDEDDEDQWSDSGFDTLSTLSQGMKSTLTDTTDTSDRDLDWGETQGPDAGHDYGQSVRYAAGPSSDINSAGTQQQDPVGDHLLKRYEGRGGNRPQEGGQSLQQASCTESQDVSTDQAHDKVSSEATGIPVQTRKQADELCSGSGIEHVVPPAQAAKASLSELSPSTRLSASGLSGPAKFVSTSQALPSSTDGRGPSAKDGISITESDEAQEYTHQRHSSDLCQESTRHRTGLLNSKVEFSAPAKVGEVSDSLGVTSSVQTVQVEAGETVKGDQTKEGRLRGKGWEVVRSEAAKDTGGEAAERPEQTGTTWNGKDDGEPPPVEATDTGSDSQTTDTCEENQLTTALSSADIFAQNMEDVKREKTEVDADPTERDADPVVQGEGTRESHGKGTSQSIEVTATASPATAGGMPAGYDALDTMSKASQDLEQNFRDVPAGISTADTQQQTHTVVSLPSVESDNASSQMEEDGEDSSSSSSKDSDSYGDSFLEYDSDDIMQEMNDMELAAEQGHSSTAAVADSDSDNRAEHEMDITDITDQPGVEPHREAIRTEPVPGTNNSQDKGTDISEPVSKKQRTAEDGSDFADQEGDREPSFDSELDVQALEKDVELISDKENVPGDNNEILTSDETKRNLSADKISDQNVVQAMRTLTQKCEEPSLRKPRPHSFHGDRDQPSQTTQSRRRYDWNTHHFFPDIHDVEGYPGWVKSYRGSRRRPHSQYVEEEWIRDLYYYDQQEMRDLLARSQRGNLTQDHSLPNVLHPDQMDIMHESKMKSKAAERLAEGAFHRTGSGERPRKVFRERKSNSDLRLNQIYYMDSESSTDSGDTSPQVWRKSALHVRRTKRRERDERPRSAEIHYSPATSRQSPRIYMGSPMLRRKEEAAKHKRTPRRTSNPTENGNSRKHDNGVSRKNSDLIQEKLQKFQELQEKRKALESSSDEFLPARLAPDSEAARKDVQRENVKEKRFGQPHPHELHLKKVESAFQYYQNQKDKSLSQQNQQESVSSSKDAADGRQEQTFTASTFSQPPNTQKRDGPTVKSQFDFRSLEDDQRHSIPHAEFYGTEYDRRKLLEHQHELSSSFENIYDGVDLSMYSMDKIDTSEFRKSVGEREDEGGQQETVAEKQRNGHVNIQALHHEPQKQEPPSYDRKHRAPPDHEQFDKQDITAEPIEVLTNKNLSQSEQSIPKLQTKELFHQGPAARSPASVRGARESPLWYVPQLKQIPAQEKPSKQSSLEKLDAKALIEEEKRKFVDYKREYHRRLSERGSTSGTSGDEMRRDSGDEDPGRIIPPDDYEYILHKVHHKRQDALYGGTPPSERAKKRVDGESKDQFLVQMQKRKFQQVQRTGTGAKQTYLTDDFFPPSDLSQSQGKLDIAPESAPLRRVQSDTFKPASPYAKYISQQADNKPNQEQFTDTSEEPQEPISIKDRVEQWNKISEVEQKQAKRRLSQEPNSNMGPYIDSKRREQSPRKEPAPQRPHEQHAKDRRYSDIERYRQEQSMRFEEEMRVRQIYGYEQPHSPRNKWVTDVQRQEYPGRVSPRKSESPQYSPRRDDFPPADRQQSPRRQEPPLSRSPGQHSPYRDPRAQQHYQAPYQKPPGYGSPQRHDSPQYPQRRSDYESPHSPQRPIYVPPQRVDPRPTNQQSFRPYTGTGNQVPAEITIGRHQTPPLRKEPPVRPEQTRSPHSDQSGHSSPKHKQNGPAQSGYPVDQQRPLPHETFRPHYQNQESFRPYRREEPPSGRPYPNQQSFRPYNPDQYDIQPQKGSQVFSTSVQPPRPIYGSRSEGQLYHPRSEDAPTDVPSHRSKSDEERDLNKHKYIAERIPEPDPDTINFRAKPQPHRPEQQYQQWRPARDPERGQGQTQGQGESPRSPGTDQYDFVPTHSRPTHAQPQLPRQTSDRIHDDSGAQFIHKKPPKPKTETIPKEIKEWRYNVSYEASPPHDSSKKKFDKFAPTQDQYDHRDTQYRSPAVGQLGSEAPYASSPPARKDLMYQTPSRDPRFPYKNYEDKVHSYCEDQKQQRAAEQYEQHIQQSRWQYHSEYIDPDTIRARKPWSDPNQATPWRSPLRRAKSLPREQSSVEMEISKTGHIQPKATPSSAEKSKPTAPLGTYKFHIQLGSTPKEPVASASPRKVSVRLSRSTEDLRGRMQDNEKEAPRVSVAAIKSQLFGEQGEKKGVFMPQYMTELSKVSDRTERNVSSIQSSVFAARGERVPHYGSQGALSSHQYDETEDVRLRDYISYKDGLTRKRSNLHDELTDLEQTFESLNLDSEGLLDGVENYRAPMNCGRTDPSSGDDPNVKRLSITNLKKLEEIQARQDNPSLEYAKQWLSTEKSPPQTEPDQVFSPKSSSDVFSPLRAARDSGSVDLRGNLRQTNSTAVSTAASVTSERELTRESSLPRKVADDMAVRRRHHQSSPNINNNKTSMTSPIASYLQYSPGITPSASMDSLARRSMSTYRTRSPDPIYDDLMYRNLQRAKSKSPGPIDPELAHAVHAEPSPTSTDYLVERTTEPARGRMRIKPEPRPDKYHDDLAYRQLRKDVDPVVAELPDAYYRMRYGGRSRLNQRSMSLERLSDGKQRDSGDRSLRSSSVGPCTRFERRSSLSSGVAKMVGMFESSLEASQSAPDLTEKSVFSGHYDVNGDLVSEDPRYKHAVKPRKKETPRTVKQRNEMKSRLRQLKSSADSGYLEYESDSLSSSGQEMQLARSPPDGAFDSDELDHSKSSDSDRHSDGGRGQAALHRREFIHQKLTKTEQVSKYSPHVPDIPARVCPPEQSPSIPVQVISRAIEKDIRATPPSSLNVPSRQTGPAPRTKVESVPVAVTQTKISAPSFSSQPTKYVPKFIPRPTESAHQFSSQPTEYVPKFNARPTESAPQFSSRPAESAPQFSSRPAESAPQFSSRPAESAPQFSSRPAESAPQFSSQPAESAPQFSTRPAETTSSRTVTVTREQKSEPVKSFTDIPLRKTGVFTEKATPGFAKISTDSPLKEIKLAIGEPGTVRGPSSYAVNLPQQEQIPGGNVVTSESKDSKEEITAHGRTAEFRKERTLTGPQKREQELKTLTVVEKPNSLQSQFESQKTQKEHQSYESPGHKVNVTTFERETLMKSSATTYRTIPGKPEGLPLTSKLPKLDILRAQQSGPGQGSPQRPLFSPHRLLMSPPSELSDGEMTDATDITLDNLVRANRPSSADTMEGFTDSEYYKKYDSDKDSNSGNDSQHEFIVSDGKTHKVTGKKITTVQTTVVRTGGGEPPKSSRSMTEVVEMTESEGKSKKGGKVERGPSFKELVRAFEDQASPFMKSSMKRGSSEEEIQGRTVPVQIAGSSSRKTLREMSGSDPDLSQGSGPSQVHRDQQRHSVDLSSSRGSGGSIAWRRY